MPTFPTTELNVVELAQNMLDGINNHAELFPGTTPDELLAAVVAYNTAARAQEQAKANAAIATETKKDALANLIASMKKNLRIAETDTLADPSALEYLGWGPRQTPTAVPVPAQPRDFLIVSQNNGSVELKWKKGTNGGAVRNYIVQRQQLLESGEWSNWQLSEFFYDTLVELVDQPTGVKLNYRIVACNATGDSLPSNTQSCVL